MQEYYRDEIRTFHRNINFVIFGLENNIVISVAVMIIIHR